MIPNATSSYIIFPSEMEGHRADFVFYHPQFDAVREFRRSAFVVPLGPIITRPQYGLPLTGLSEGNVGFLNTQHITRNGEIIFDPPVFIEDCPDGVLLKEGDILFARTGFTLGKVAYVTDSFADYAFGSFCLRFSVLPSADFRTDFITRFLNSQVGQLQILMLRSGSDKPNINSEQIQDIRVPQIDLRTQDKLIEASKVIEAEALALDKRAKEVRSSAESAMLNELGFNMSLTNTSINYSFKSGVDKKTLWFTLFPEEITDRLHYLFYYSPHHILDALRDRYRTVPLADICNVPVIRGEQPVYDDSGSVTVLKTLDLKDGYIDYDNALKVSQEFFDAHPTTHVQGGDILITSAGSGSMGRVAVYERDEAAMISGELLALRVKKDYDPYFVAYFLRSPFGQTQFDKWFSGSSGIIHIYEADIAQFLIPVSGDGGVTLKEQKRITSVVTEHLNQAHELERQASAKWQETRKKFEKAISSYLQKKATSAEKKGLTAPRRTRSNQSTLFE